MCEWWILTYKIWIIRAISICYRAQSCECFDTENLINVFRSRILQILLFFLFENVLDLEMLEFSNPFLTLQTWHFIASSYWFFKHSWNDSICYKRKTNHYYIRSTKIKYIEYHLYLLYHEIKKKGCYMNHSQWKCDGKWWKQKYDVVDMNQSLCS